MGSKKKIRPNNVFILLTALVIIITITLSIITIVNVSRLSKETVKLKETITLTTSASKETLDTLFQNSLLLSRDVNEIHSILKMPQTEYPLITSNAESENNDEDSTLAFLKAIETLFQHEKRKSFIEDFTKTLKKDSFKEIIEKYSFDFLRPEDEIALLNKKDCTFFRILGNPNKNSIIVKAFTGEEKVFPKQEKTADGSTFAIREIIYFITSNQDNINHILEVSENLKPLLLGLKEQEDVEKIVQKKNLHWEELQVLDKEYRLPLKNRDGKILLRPGIDRSKGTFILENKITGYDDFYNVFLQRLKELDGRTAEEKTIDASFNAIREVIEKDSFIKALDAYEIKISTAIREDDDYYYFDIISSGNNHIGAFAVLKKEGVIYLTDDDDIVISSIKTLHTGMNLEKKN